MDCRTTLAHKFRTRLGFKQYDFILTKEQSVLTKIMNWSEGENMQTQYNVLSYRIDLYFHDCRLAIEIFENGYIKQSIEKALINKILVRLLGFKFKSNNVIKSKAIKFIVKNILSDYR